MRQERVQVQSLRAEVLAMGRNTESLQGLLGGHEDAAARAASGCTFLQSSLEQVWLAVPKVRKSGPVGWKFVDFSGNIPERNLLIL